VATIPVGRDQVIGLGAAVTEIPDGQHARTRYSPDEGLVMIEFSETAWGWLQTGHPRGLYTLWHELGHAYLHIRELLDREWIEHQTHVLARNGRPTHKFYQDSEWQADTFAACALAPMSMLRHLKSTGRLSPEILAQTAGISEESARYRISNAVRLQEL
jgi:hypothetical protein